MAGGPIFPFSRFPVLSGSVFPYTYVGAGANKHEQGLGVAASIAANSIWRLRFAMPPTLPTGTGKLRLLALANATSGAAKINAKWASVAAEESPSAATLSAEGTGTITWASGDADQYKELKITLDAVPLVASEIIAMDLTFEATGWTLAQISVWQSMIIWE